MLLIHLFFNWKLKMALKMLFFFFKRKSALCIFAVWSTNHNGVNPSLKKVKKKGFFSYKHVVEIIKSVWPESQKRLCWKVVCCVYIQRDQGGKRLKKKRHCICTHTHTHTQAKGLQPLVVHVSQHMHTYDQTSRGINFPSLRLCDLDFTIRQLT
jgi:hypothetical protein